MVELEISLGSLLGSAFKVSADEECGWQGWAEGRVDPDGAATKASADPHHSQGALELPSVASPVEGWAVGLYIQPHLISQLLIGCKL